MNKEKLLRVLKYAQNAVKHPEYRNYGQFQHIYTDGVVLNYQPTSQQVEEELFGRLNRIKEYEQFVKEVNELIKENEQI